jgi:hypothetical protein
MENWRRNKVTRLEKEEGRKKKVKEGRNVNRVSRR